MNAKQVKSVADLKRWVAEVYPDSKFFQNRRKGERFISVKNRGNQIFLFHVMKNFFGRPIYYIRSFNADPAGMLGRSSVVKDFDTMDNKSISSVEAKAKAYWKNI